MVWPGIHVAGQLSHATVSSVRSSGSNVDDTDVAVSVVDASGSPTVDRTRDDSLPPLSISNVSTALETRLFQTGLEMGATKAMTVGKFIASGTVNVTGITAVRTV